jgi:acetyl-CoA synthetase
MKKEGDLYFPTEEFKRQANVFDPNVYKIAEKDPVKFWKKLAKKLFWFKKWKKVYEEKPPYFKWFLGGKTNLTSNVFEKNPLGWEKIRERPAIIWEPEPEEEKPKILTYQQLFSETAKLGNALKNLGLKKGDVVGIYLPMIPETLVSMLACARLGFPHIVIFSAFSPSALKQRLKISGAKILITADGYWRRGKIIDLKKSADEGIKGTKVEKVIVVKRLQKEIPIDQKREFWYEGLLAKEKPELEAKILDSENIFFILPESGTTGEFLPIFHTLGGYLVYAYWTGKFVFDFKENDVLWSMADVGWITGHTYTVYSPLLNGITTLIYEGAPDWPSSERWAQIIEKHKVTIFYTSPTAIRMFEKSNAEIEKKYKFESLRILASVGEPMSEEKTWLWYFEKIGKGKCPVLDTYWQTETGGILISSLPGLGPFKPTFVGLPFPGVKVEIFDEEGKPTKPNQKGNLVILPPFPPGMMRGIYKNPEKYKKVYWSRYGERVYFTADAALKDENGLIKILGRVDEVMKVAGHRIGVGEIEAAVNSHSQVVESAVVGQADEIKGEVPVVFVVSKTKDEKIVEEIKETIRKKIGPIALPKEIYLVEDLPKTRSGKIMRVLLKRLVEKKELGDLSPLANPEVVEKIKKVIK